jgi:hypothetical protein
MYPQVRWMLPRQPKKALHAERWLNDVLDGNSSALTSDRRMPRQAWMRQELWVIEGT